MAKMNNTQLTYLRQRIDGLFASAHATLKDRAFRKENEIRKQVMDKMGIKKAEEAAQKLIDDVHAMNRHWAEVFGMDIIHSAQYLQLMSYSKNFANGSIGGLIKRAIDAELALTPEGEIMERLNLKRNELEDRIMLDWEEASPMQILADVERQIQEIIGTTKALAAAPPTTTKKSK